MLVSTEAQLIKPLVPESVMVKWQVLSVSAISKTKWHRARTIVSHSWLQAQQKRKWAWTTLCNSSRIVWMVSLISPTFLHIVQLLRPTRFKLNIKFKPLPKAKSSLLTLMAQRAAKLEIRAGQLIRVYRKKSSLRRGSSKTCKKKLIQTWRRFAPKMRPMPISVHA